MYVVEKTVLSLKRIGSRISVCESRKEFKAGRFFPDQSRTQLLLLIFFDGLLFSLLFLRF
jgi:hypothetical protein